MTKEIIGFILIFLGVSIILGGLWQSYEIFTARKNAPEIFKISLPENETAPLPQNSSLNSPNNQVIPAQVWGMLQEQLKNAFSPQSTNHILNLASWSMFMAILVMAAGKIAMIGVGLLKTASTEKNN
jgi:hypothetical protein